MDFRRSQDAPPGRPPFGLIGMLALVILFETFLDGRMSGLMNLPAHCWWWANRAASRPAAVHSEILAFGSSLSKLGVAPAVIQAQSGRSVWNLAVLGGRPPNAYYALRRALDAGARPRAVLLDTALMELAGDEEPRTWAQVLRPVEAAEMAWAQRDGHFLGAFGCAWLLPSARCRWEIRTAIGDACRGAGTPYRQQAVVNNRHWMVNRGAFIQPSTVQMNPIEADAIDRLTPEDRRAGRWEAKAINVTYLDRFLDLAARRQIPVYWLLPPRYRSTERINEQPNRHGLQRQFVRERVARYPNITVVDGLTSGYGREMLIDAYHVNRRGAVAWSLALGQVLRDRLDRPMPADPGARWLELPRIAGPPAETLVEDTLESAARVAKPDAGLATAAAASTPRR